MDKYTEINGRQYRRYRVTADLLCVGDRIRGSVYRPCLDVLPATTLEGTLRHRFPRPTRCVYVVGRLLKARRQSLVYSPRDRALGVSIVPIQTEYLADVEAEVLVRLNDFTVEFPEKFDLQLGAMKAQGFGRSRWELVEDSIPAEPSPRPALLYTRLPDTPKWREALGITGVVHPVYGYLPIPERGARTYYQRALFEGSEVIADSVVVCHSLASSVEEPIGAPDPRSDPMVYVLAALPNTASPKQQDGPVASVLHVAGEVLARYGYAVAKMHLEEKLTLKQKAKAWVEAALQAVEALETREPTRSNPELGAYILRKLHLVGEWKSKFGRNVEGSQPEVPLREAFGEAIERARAAIETSEEFHQGRDKVRPTFATEVANAIGRYGGSVALNRLDAKAQQWQQARRERRQTGQRPEVVALMRRTLEQLAEVERLGASNNVARLFIKHFFRASDPQKRADSRRPHQSQQRRRTRR